MRSLVRRVLPLDTRNQLRSYATWVEWATHDLPRGPALEWLSWRLDRQNQRFFRQVQAEEAAGSDAWLEPAYARDIPRVIWMFWRQGVDEAPAVVRRCIDSWRELNPGWEVRVLDGASLDAYVPSTDIPPGTKQALFADVVRLRLLAKYGGVWVDSTVLCHRPLDEWLGTVAGSGFFVFDRPGPGRPVASWFIASEANGPIVSEWERVLSQHLQRLAGDSKHYFLVMYAFQHALTRCVEMRERWAQTATLPALPTFLLHSVLEGRTAESEVVKRLRAGLPVSKLKWRAPYDHGELDRILEAARQETKD